MSAPEPATALDALTRRIETSFGKQSFMTTLGARLTRIAAGEVEVALPVSQHLSQQHGFVHAGAVSSIADSAAGYAALSLMPEGAGVLTVEFKINLLAPAAGETLLAKGRVVKAGRTLTLSQAEVFAVKAGASRLCAVLSATLMTIAGRDGVSD